MSISVEEYRKLTAQGVPGKYHAKRTVYNGVSYHSQREANYAAELDNRVRAKDLKEWRRQVPIRLFVNGQKICTYHIDFLEINNDGSEVYTEIKSVMTAKLRDFKIIWRLFEALHPDLKKQVVM